MALNSHYVLDNEIEIVKADLKEFAIHYTTYRENIFFRQSWERRISIFAEDAPCYWITFKNRRIGGVCIEPNLLSSFFLETPFQDILRVLIPLKKFLIHCSDPSKPIEAFGILPYETEHFLRLGFLPSESRRVMIRPTEIFEPQEWGEEFEAVAPGMDQIDRIAEMLHESYSDIDRIGYPGDNTIDSQRTALEYYFVHNQDEILKSASTIIYDKQHNNIVAVCLISLWEDLPLVSNIAVMPQYRSRQLATKLLKKAVTVLKEEYDVIRLFVTIGNSAEALYYRLGFYPGLEQTTFHLPLRDRSF
ncbi:GNAT family N-acetyltransferase [Paenibacillus azoreducens]|uniref:GNAT family N-acetyltransferase n=1 Tax=Paenibacillus azoreducens TaxID=116718 RepID=UPI0039F60EC5